MNYDNSLHEGREKMQLENYLHRLCGYPNAGKGPDASSPDVGGEE